MPHPAPNRRGGKERSDNTNQSPPPRGCSFLSIPPFFLSSFSCDTTRDTITVTRPFPVRRRASQRRPNHELSPCPICRVLYIHPIHTLPHAPLYLLSRLERTGTTQLPWRSPAIRRQLSTERRERGSHRPPGRGAPYLARRGAAPKMVRKIRTGVFPEHFPLKIKQQTRVDYVEQVEEILAATHAKGARASVTTSQVS